jgi:mannose-6-phosphate isomerase-like protein (cupin superfamily)
VAEPVAPMATLVEQARAARTGYYEFLRRPAMSAGVYVLPKGGIDRQRPHAEDEVYFVARGVGEFTCGEARRAVATADVLYVPARVPHHFHDIAEELVLLVVFAPAETPTA